MSEIDVMTRWHYIGYDCWSMPGDGYLYGDCESSALAYNIRIDAYRTSDVFLEATVAAQGSVFAASGQERYYSGFGLVAEDDPVMSYATIQLARNVAPAEYGRHTISLTLDGVAYTLMEAVPDQTYRLRLRYLGRTNSLLVYVDGVLKKTTKWYPTMAPYVEVINVAVEAGQVGPERASCTIGSLTYNVSTYTTEGWS